MCETRGKRKTEHWFCSHIDTVSVTMSARYGLVETSKNGNEQLMLLPVGIITIPIDNVTLSFAVGEQEIKLINSGASYRAGVMHHGQTLNLENCCVKVIHIEPSVINVEEIMKLHSKKRPLDDVIDTIEPLKKKVKQAECVSEVNVKNGKKKNDIIKTLSSTIQSTKSASAIQSTKSASEKKHTKNKRKEKKNSQNKTKKSLVEDTFYGPITYTSIKFKATTNNQGSTGLFTVERECPFPKCTEKFSSFGNMQRHFSCQSHVQYMRKRLTEPQMLVFGFLNYTLKQKACPYCYNEWPAWDNYMHMEQHLVEFKLLTAGGIKIGPQKWPHMAVDVAKAYGKVKATVISGCVIDPILMIDTVFIQASRTSQTEYARMMLELQPLLDQFGDEVKLLSSFEQENDFPMMYKVYIFMTFGEPNWGIVISKDSMVNFLSSFRENRLNQATKLYGLSKTNKFAYSVVCVTKKRSQSNSVRKIVNGLHKSRQDLINIVNELEAEKGRY